MDATRSKRPRETEGLKMIEISTPLLGLLIFAIGFLSGLCVHIFAHDCPDKPKDI